MASPPQPTPLPLSGCQHTEPRRSITPAKLQRHDLIAPSLEQAQLNVRVLVYRGEGPVKFEAEKGLRYIQDQNEAANVQFLVERSEQVSASNGEFEESSAAGAAAENGVHNGEPVVHYSSTLSIFSRHCGQISAVTTAFPGQNVAVNGRAYRGDFVVYDDGKILEVVNIVDLEGYLRGVVPRELLSSQLEAMKAQALVARTYALAHRRPGQRWDVRDDAGHQVYGGVAAEHSLADQAVESTRGLVLTYEGKLVSEALYHSTCGGQTEGNYYVFGTTPVPYLQSVSCYDEQGHPYCSASSYASWQTRWESQDLGQELAKYVGKSYKSVKSINILELGPSGRVAEMAVVWDNSQVTKLAHEEIRQAFYITDSTGHKRPLPSTCITVKPEISEASEAPTAWMVEGNGWGHGVGMCQWGAVGLAKAGYNFVEILSYYYTGVDVRPVVEVEQLRKQP